MSKVAPNQTPPANGLPDFAPIAGADPALPLLRPESIQRHLENLVLSAQMRHSRKLCQFLRYTVEEVLKGHGSELKEYAIGVGAFRRTREFDPGADPIVRVQARRLRSKLELYYQTEGRDEAVRIEYPKGSYSPIFTRRTPVAAPRLAHPGIQVHDDKSVRHIAILPFIGVGGAGSEAFGDGLTDELMHTLSSWPEARIIARSSCFQFKGRSEDARRIGEWLGASALVSGSVRIEGAHDGVWPIAAAGILKVNVNLAGSIDADPAEIAGIRVGDYFWIDERPHLAEPRDCRARLCAKS